jgi:hypothetical protein
VKLTTATGSGVAFYAGKPPVVLVTGVASFDSHDVARMPSISILGRA